MPDLLGSLKANAKYRALSVEAQTEIAFREAGNLLRQDPRFLALSPQAQDAILRREALKGVTFDDPALELKLKDMAVNVVDGAAGSLRAKQGYEFFQSLIKGSGALGLLESAMAGELAPALQADRRRALSYTKVIDKVAHRSDIAAEAGSILGQIADIAAVSAVTGPLTSAASAGIEASARGMTTAALKAAKAAGKALPALAKPGLAFYGPLAAETAIEALPYFITSEQQRIQAGAPTAASQGIAEVAKTLGINAAMDFAFSTVLMKIGSAALKTGKKVFKKSSLYEEAFKNPEQFEAQLRDIAVGATDPQTLNRMHPFDKALLHDRDLMVRFTKEGITAPDMFPKERAGFFGVRQGMPWDEVVETLPDGSKKVSYNLFVLDKKTNAWQRRVYQNFSDLEDHIAYKNFEAYSSLTDPAMKQEFEKRGGSYLLKRGEMIHKQMSILGSDNIVAMDDYLSREARKVPTPKQRIVITRSEANFLSKPDSGITAVQAEIPLTGKLLENVNRAELDLLRGTGTAVVKQSANPNALFIGVSEASQEVYAHATQVAEELVRRGQFADVAEARASYMLTRGFDHSKLPDGTVEFFNTRSMRLIGTPQDVLNSMKKPFAAGAHSGLVIVQEKGTITKEAAGAFGSSETTMAAMQKIARETGDPDSVRVVTKGYLEARGLKDTRVDVRRWPKAEYGITKLDDGTIQVQMPAQRAATFAEEQTHVRTFMEQLEKQLGDLGKAKPKAEGYWLKKATEMPRRFTLSGFSDPLEWAKAAALRLGGDIEVKPDRIHVMLPGTRGGFKSFLTQDELVNYVARQTLDYGAIEADLIRQGVKLTRSPAGSIIARTLHDGRLLASGSLDEVLDKISYVPSSLDIAFGPTAFSFSEGKVAITFAGKQVFKTQAEAMQMMAQFKDQNFLNKTMNVLINKKGTVDFTPNGTFHVYSAKLAAGKEFNTLAEARRWLETDVKSIDDLKEVADKKFLDFYVDRGSYVVVARDNAYRVKTITEVEEIFKKYPDIDLSAPNVLDDFDPTIEVSVADAVQKWQGKRYIAKANKYNLPPEWADLEKPKEMSAYMNLRAITSEMNAWVEDVARRTNNPTLRKLYLALQAGLHRAQSESYRVARVADTIFRGSNGKTLSEASLKKIHYHLSANGTDDAAALAAQYTERYGTVLAPLTHEEQIVADRLKEVYDALSIKFNIPSDKMLNNYIPRLRDAWARANKEGLAQNMATADLLVDYAWQGKPPAELKFWAENERTEEIARFWVKDDPREVLLLYSAQGHKKLYANTAWKEWADYAREAKIEDAVANRMDFYRMQVMGSYHTPAEKAIEHFGEALFTRIGKTPIGKAAGLTEAEWAERGKSLLSSFMGLTYFSSMGWKPWLAIRNVISGPMVGGAGRLGLQWVMRGWDDVLAKGDSYIDYLRRIGQISERPPLVNQVFSHNTKLGKIAEKSMEWFKNSDDLGRAIVYRGAEMRFDEAYGLLKTGKIQTRKIFEEAAGLDVMEPETRDFVWSKITRQGASDVDMVQARHEFASRITTETQFEYSGANAPMMFKGAVGKLFGQFGTYSAGYRANLARMFKYGSFPRKMQQIATYLAVTGALWATFDALKIKTNDFIPIAPSIFTGGTCFDVGLDVIRSADPGYEGEQARARLKYSVPSLFPGSAQLRYGAKALKYAEEGNTYATLLSLTGISYIDE